MEFAAGVLLEVKMVNVEVPVPKTELGEKLAVAPAGRPLALNVTFPENSPVLVIVTVNFVLPPPPDVCVPGVAATVKSPVALMLTPHDEIPTAARRYNTQIYFCIWVIWGSLFPLVL
jgi:hypothetical protein